MPNSQQPALHELTTALCAPNVVLSSPSGRITCGDATGAYRHDRRSLAHAEFAVPTADLVAVGSSSGAGQARFQGVVREQIAESRMEIDQARLMVLKTADLIDKHGAKGARGEIAAVSGEIRHLVETGVAEADAYAAGTWPFPYANLAAGIARGYADLAGHGLKGTRPTLPLA